MNISRAELTTAIVVAFGVIGVGGGAPLAQTVREDFCVTNGPVRAMALEGETLYIGGDFTRVGPATGSCVPIDSASGSLAIGFPKVVGAVYALASDGTGGWYVGGDFTSVGGVPRSNLAHIESDLSVSPWDPGTNDAVLAITVSGGTVYVGGRFSYAGGQARSSIAAIDASTGLGNSWDPSGTPISGGVSAIAVSGSTVYVSGGFTSIGGQARNGIAALDGSTGLATVWNPNALYQSYPGAVYAIAVSGGMVYAGGEFTNIGGQARTCLAALDASTGLATSWDPAVSGYVIHTLACDSERVYVGGEFSAIGGASRQGIAAVDSATGLATSWNPNADGPHPWVRAIAISGATVYAAGDFTYIGGAARGGIAALDPTTGVSDNWNPDTNGSVYAIAAGQLVIYAGGTFTGVGGKTRNHIAAVNIATGQPTSWDPNATSSVYALAAAGSAIYAGGNFVIIGGALRYRIAQIDSQTGLATPWDPSADNTVNALVVAGSAVYAGGLFGSIGGQSRSRMAALDASSGLANTWNPNPSGNSPSWGQQWGICVTGSTVYVGGSFNSVGGQSRVGLAAVDPSTGQATSWNPNASGSVYALGVSGSDVYAGGSYSAIGGQTLRNLAALDTATALATSWNPLAGPFYINILALTGTEVLVGGRFDSMGGQPRRNIAAVDLQTGSATPWAPSTDGEVYSLALNDSVVYVGGAFRSTGDLSQSYLAAIRKRVPTAVSLVMLDAEADAGWVKIRWYAPSEGITMVSVYRRTIDSEWMLEGHPVVGQGHDIIFEDRTVQPGTRYGYRLVVRDASAQESAIETWVSVPEARPAPSVVHLEPVRPNPLGARGELIYGMPRSGRVRLAVYDVHGRRVATVVDGEEAAGWRSAVWDGRDLIGRPVASGTYFARLETAGMVRVRKVVIAK